MPDDAQVYDRDFSPGFLRKILALGVKSGLNKRVPGALLPAHFSGLAAGGRNASPRQRLAEVVERFERSAPGEHPGVETMDMLVERERARMRSDEGEALATEWAEVRAVSVVDAAYVEHEVREWVERLGVARAILDASALYERGASAAEVRGELMRALRASDSRPASRIVSVLATFPQRVAIWEAGDDAGPRVPTGFGPLDRALGGGVRLGEFFVFLAPPKGAKTTSLMNAWVNASRLHYGGLFCSFEMGERAMLLRADRNVAGATRVELRAEPERLARLYRGLVAGGAGEMFLRTGSPMERGAVDAVVKDVEDLRREGHDVEGLYFDFLNIIGANEGELEKRHELAQVARHISQAAKHLEVATWSAALVKQASIAKAKLRKNDLAESHEVVAVVDGLVGICAPEELVVQGMRSFYLAALREEGDEKYAGVYEIDVERMRINAVGDSPASAGDAEVG